MSNTIVVYATRSGHSRALAQELASKLGGEAREIVDLVNRKGLLGFIRSGRQAVAGAATPIRDPGVDLSSVSRVVLVQPVWASAICPPIRSWLRAHSAELSGKTLALLCSAGGAPASALRAKYDSEFSGQFGSLAACAVVRRDDASELRSSAVDRFIAELGRA